MRRIIEDVARTFRPDVVHVQHAMFLDTGFDAGAPMVWTLHDAWGWCAAGGQLLREGRACDGPGSACAACASGWVRDGAVATGLVSVAGAISGMVPPERLHSAWQRLPVALRSLANRPSRTALSPGAIERRRASLRSFAARCAVRIAPSRFYAKEAERQGMGAVRVVSHGCDPPAGGGAGVRAVAGDGAPRPFVSAGTLAVHKGHHVVAEAWRRAGVASPLRIHGPPGSDPAYVASLDHGGPIEDVGALLAGARALVLGSIWAENAPLVVLEARAVGCPIVAPRIGGVPELVVDGVDGWLYPPGDVEALAECLRAAERELRTPRPPPSFAEHVRALEAIYREVVG